jgi:RNA polymerase sigma-70 factor (ECF subfamily)
VNQRQDGAEIASDEELLVGFLAGDDGAFAVLVERYSQELWEFVGRFVRSLTVAEDIVQETFIQVHQSAGGFDTSRRFRPWLFTIAANKARDHLRGRARKKEIPLSLGARPGDSEDVSYLDFLSDASVAPSAALEDQERREVVRAVVSRMPDHLREVLILGYYNRLAYKEIAEVLSVPLGTVKSRLHAAVSHFATAYKRETEERPPQNQGRGQTPVG